MLAVLKLAHPLKEDWSLRPQRAGAVAFLTAMVTLATQVLVHRMVSAKLANNFAFLVISLTMLGFAVSGIVLTRLRVSSPDDLRERLAAWAAGFAVSLLGTTAYLYHASVRVALPTRTDFVLELLGFLPGALLLAVPFAFCGLMLGALLSSPELPTRRIYAADLLGSAVGAFAVLPAISWFGVEASLLGLAALFVVGVALVTAPRSLLSRSLCGGALLILALGASEHRRVYDLRYPDGSGLAQLKPPYGVEHVAWDPVARIEVSRVPPPDPERFPFPSLVGTNREFLNRFQRLITQNNTAFTYAVRYDGQAASLRGIEETMYAAAYQVTSVKSPRVLIIGVGGGFDILTALAFDPGHVTAVEINAATVRILRDTYHDYFKTWVEDPRVRLVTDDGRHYLASHDDRFHVIQLSGVDSYSGTAAATNVFSESYLYTEEAFDLYLSRLEPDGILNMMRLEHLPAQEMVRALATAVDALRRTGVERPADHVLVLRDKTGRFVALLVKKTPFTAAEVERAAAWAGPNPYIDLAAAPGRTAPIATVYQEFLSLGNAHQERLYLRSIPFNVAPVDDDRPFFFRFSFWWHLFSTQAAVGSSFPAMELSVLVLLAGLSFAVLACVYLPLRVLAAQGLRVPGAGRYAAYFGGIGLGYLGVEVALLQKFSLFLGHPNYALSVVLAALLLATGFGSLTSARIERALGGIRFVAYALVGTVLLEYLLVFPRLGHLIGLMFVVRVAIVFLLVVPVGALLGVFFPSGLQQLKPRAPAFVAWAWGINGIFSVVAPVLSIAFSMTWGINALLLAAMLVYLATALVVPSATPSELGA